jgi:hypothetical protein
MMTAAILQFPGNHHAPGGQAFTDAALDLARDVIAGKPPFWPAVIVLAESPAHADRDRAAQILEGHRLAMDWAGEQPLPVPQSTPVARVMNAVQLALAGMVCLGIAALVVVALLRGVM